MLRHHAFGFDLVVVAVQEQVNRCAKSGPDIYPLNRAQPVERMVQQGNVHVCRLLLQRFRRIDEAAATEQQFAVIVVVDTEEHTVQQQHGYPHLPDLHQLNGAAGGVGRKAADSGKIAVVPCAVGLELLKLAAQGHSSRIKKPVGACIVVKGSW